MKNIIVENSIDSGIYIKGKNNTLDHIVTRYNRYAGIQIDVEADNNILKKIVILIEIFAMLFMQMVVLVFILMELKIFY